MSRTTNSIRNIITSIFGQCLTVILQFITRTFFIDILGKQYLGISGLFTNIISMLSLAELGVGTAIMYKLYQPIKEKNEHRIYLIMKFYKSVYRVIGLVILIAGLLLMPFLKNLIKDDISFINIYLIFLLYLIQSVSSYLFFAYKSALIHANQKEYLTTVVNYIFILFSNLLQIIGLVLFESFTFFVAVSIFTTIAMNIVVSKMCDRMYPFILKKSSETLERTERKNIFKDCYALVIYKANAVVLNATDNIVLSAFIGLNIVGIYSNYLMIYTFINSVMTRVYSAINASLGNLHAEKNPEHEYDVFNMIHFISFALFSVASIGIAFVSSEFIALWLGKEFLLDGYVVLLIGYKMYIDGQKKVLSTYRNTMGLFQQAKYRPLAGAVINIIVSVVLVQYMGIAGVIAGTIIADLSTYMWYDPYIIFKHSFKHSVASYYLKRVLYTLVLIVSAGLTGFVIAITDVEGVLGLILHAGFCVLIPGIVICILFSTTKEFKRTVMMGKNLLKKIKRGKGAAK